MDDLDLAYAGIARQAELVRAGEVSPVELVELYLRRIERIDQHLNAFRVVLAERALAEARQAEGRSGAGGGRAGGGGRRPVVGVAGGVKEHPGRAGEGTAYGSRAYGPPAAADSEVV